MIAVEPLCGAFGRHMSRISEFDDSVQSEPVSEIKYNSTGFSASPLSAYDIFEFSISAPERFAAPQL